MADHHFFGDELIGEELIGEEEEEYFFGEEGNKQRVRVTFQDASERIMSFVADAIKMAMSRIEQNAVNKVSSVVYADYYYVWNIIDMDLNPNQWKFFRSGVEVDMPEEIKAILLGL